MCFKKPKIPKASEVPKEDPLLKEQVRQASEAERARRSADKEARLEDLLAGGAGGYGRRSLLTGSRGGAGFSAPMARSLFVPG